MTFDTSNRLMLDTQMIEDKLRSNRFGHPVHYVQSVDSTQSLAKKYIRNGAQEGTLFIAEQQTAGRGRQGKSWHSPAGKGLWLSVILKPNIPRRFWPQLTLLASVAICLAIREETGLDARIKWPNDIFVHGRKVSGVLLESCSYAATTYIIAGIGISVNLERDDFPPSLQSISSSLLLECGKPIDRMSLLLTLMEQLEQCVEQYEKYGFSPIRALWTTLSLSLQKQMTVRMEDGAQVTGVALRLDQDGALLLQTEQEILRIFSGVQH